MREHATKRAFLSRPQRAGTEQPRVVVLVVIDPIADPQRDVPTAGDPDVGLDVEIVEGSAGRRARQKECRDGSAGEAARANRRTYLP